MNKFQFTVADKIGPFFTTGAQSDALSFLRDEIEEINGPLKPSNSKLFHYTSFRGLEGILKSKEFWVTRIDRQSDFTELQILAKHIYKYLTDKVFVIEETRAKMELSEIKKHFRYLYKLRDKYLNSFNSATKNVFVGCFCEIEDHKYQWENHCPKSGGYSINLDFKAFESWSKRLFLYIKCNYKFEIENIDITRFVERIWEYLKDGKKVNEERIFLETLILLTIGMGTMFKDIRFSQEAEWRIVKFTNKEFAKNYVHRFKRESKFVSYLELDFSQVLNDKNIVSFTVGPSKNQDESHEKLEALLKNHGYSGYTINRSKIPYESLEFPQ